MPFIFIILTYLRTIIQVGTENGVLTLLLKIDGKTPDVLYKNGPCNFTGAVDCGLVVAAEQIFRIIAERFIRVDVT